MNKQEIIKKISERKEILKVASQKLKAYFIGIDDVIDKIITNIEAWYCMPELLTRPTIVNLWGMTGNGKTDLVRKLIKLISFEDNFVEIQMTNRGSSAHVHNTTIQSLLEDSNICPEEPGVLLLDEIQRFRSIDQDGKEIHDYIFQDLWMLLSDGSFGSDADKKNSIVRMLLDAIYENESNNIQREMAESTKNIKKNMTEEEIAIEKSNKEIELKRKFKQNYWQANHLKKKLKLLDSVEEIMKWDPNKKVEIISEKLKDKSIYKPELYSKLLIFISGNIDEAYSMSRESNDADMDADIFHKHSSRINLIDIKTALSKRFKPEQIARFGNTHVIYKALSKESYKKIIKSKVAIVLENVAKSSELNFTCDKSVYDAIYRNGVFPVQGTRPVLSTISSFFESNLPQFTLKALQADQKEINLFYKSNHLCAEIGNEIVKVKNEGDIDKVRREKRNEDNICKVAAHEVGHAVTYAYYFGYVPTQISVLTSSSEKNGFIGLHNIDNNKQFFIYKIRVFLAGLVAEELFFGKDMMSEGIWGDLEQATKSAALMCRYYGMGENISRMNVENGNNSIFHNIEIDATNAFIEKTLQEQKIEVEKFLTGKIKLIRLMADHLVAKEKISNKKFIEMCKVHGIECEYLDAKQTIYPKFKKIYEEKAKCVITG